MSVESGRPVETSRAGGAPSPLRVAAAFAAIYLIWGSTYLAIRFAIETLPPFLMAAARFLVAGAILYAWARRHGAVRPSGSHLRHMAVIGGLLLLGGNGGVVWAEQRVASGLTALLVATVPLWMVLIDWLRPGGIRPAMNVSLGLAAGFAGVVLMIDPRGAGDAGVDPVGALVLVGASLSWSVGSLYSRHAAQPGSPLLASGMQMLAGGALLGLAGTATGEWAALDPGRASAVSLVALAYLIGAGSIVGFSAYVWLLKVTTPARVATYAYVNPLVAVVLGWALGGEALTGRTMLAAAVIIGAVVLITTYRARGGGGPRPPQETDASALVPVAPPPSRRRPREPVGCGD